MVLLPSVASPVTAAHFLNQRTFLGYYSLATGRIVARIVPPRHGYSDGEPGLTVQPLLNVRQVALLLNVAPRAVYRLVSGGLPHIRLDAGRLRFRERDLEAWLAARERIEVRPSIPTSAPVSPVAPAVPASGLAPVSWPKRRAS